MATPLMQQRKRSRKQTTPTLAELMDLTNKTAIVTGGAIGIGLGIARRLAEAGANVVIADIGESNLAIAKQSFAKEAIDVECVLADISQGVDVARVTEHALNRFGGIDILVNNAGIYPNVPFMEMAWADFDYVLSVNLKGAFVAMQAVAKQMIKQGRGGKIINITSIDALHPSSIGLAHYDASKHGLWGLTKNTALELAPHKIWVNAVAPGSVATPGVQTAQAFSRLPKGANLEAMVHQFVQRIPMQRIGEPDDIARVVLFLASDLSGYMTGSQIVVDGGMLLA